jgi:hypothetical protein
MDNVRHTFGGDMEMSQRSAIVVRWCTGTVSWISLTMQLGIGIDEASGTCGERMAKGAHSLRSGFAGGHHPRRGAFLFFSTALCVDLPAMPVAPFPVLRNHGQDLAKAHTSEERLKQRLLHT